MHVRASGNAKMLTAQNTNRAKFKMLRTPTSVIKFSVGNQAATLHCFQTTLQCTVNLTAFVARVKFKVRCLQKIYLFLFLIYIYILYTNTCKY